MIESHNEIGLAYQMKLVPDVIVSCHRIIEHDNLYIRVVSSTIPVDIGMYLTEHQMIECYGPEVIDCDSELTFITDMDNNYWCMNMADTRFIRRKYESMWAKVNESTSLNEIIGLIFDVIDHEND